ncbi:hypothetical protein CsSME_00052680 [Camellia sinensis var. sinensis]
MSDQVSKKQIGTGCRIGDLYVVESLNLPQSTSLVALSSFQLDSQSTKLGTIHQTSCTDTLAQNGRAERKHPVLTVAFLLNRMLTPLLSGRSPYAALYSQPSNYYLLRVFGSACFVLLPHKDRTTIMPNFCQVVAVLSLFINLHPGPHFWPAGCRQWLWRSAGQASSCVYALVFPFNKLESPIVFPPICAFFVAVDL